MSLRILIVDDHPMTVAAYVNILNEVNFGNRTRDFVLANNCEEAYAKINDHNNQNEAFDFALLDVSIPPFSSKNILDGVDVGKYLRKKMKNCKIVMQTMHSEALKVHSIVNQLQPEGFISKNDIDFESFPVICKRVLDGEYYVSATIRKAQDEIAKNNLAFDAHDNKILTLLSLGVKTINLPEFIPLSLSSIEKRKATIKEQILQEKGSDLDLLQKARKLGLI